MGHMFRAHQPCAGGMYRAGEGSFFVEVLGDWRASVISFWLFLFCRYYGLVASGFFVTLPGEF